MTTVHVVKPVYVVPVVDHHHHASAAPAVKADTPALVKVKLPADATLYVDGMKTDLTSETRTFKTPALENGRDYYYTIRVEAVRDGEKVSQNQRVIVRGGQTSEVSFGEFPVAAKSEPAKEPPAKAPARITVKLPSDARLYVDGVLCPQKAVGVRSFETPKLETGVTYAYTLKAEVVRNGQPVVQTKRVEMQAGKEVSIDFGDLTTVQAASR